jgi:hypothetical protein
VKLLDFGLARRQDDDAHLTGSGAVVGTPAYMSPEQARGDKVDHRTDLFSLGVMLYRLCTGKMPFTGNSTMAVLTSLAVDTPAPVRQLRPELPEPLEAVVAKLLAKDPGARFPSAKDVVEAIRDVERPKASGSTPAVVAVPVPPMAVGAQTQDVWQGIDASDSVPVPLATSAEPATETPAPPAAAPREKPARKASRVPLILAGVALLAATAILAVALPHALKKKEPTVQSNDPKENDPPTPVKPPPVAADPDRAAAAWVIAQGGSVRVNGEEKDIKAAAGLPKGQFTLTGAGLADTKVTDAGLAQLKGLKNLTRLHVRKTKVSAKGLAEFHAAVPACEIEWDGGVIRPKK